MIEKAARRAYEMCNEQTCVRVPWCDLPEHWKDYWRKVAKTVLETKDV